VGVLRNTAKTAYIGRGVNAGQVILHHMESFPRLAKNTSIKVNPNNAISHRGHRARY
jgi:hypothetical protein